MPAAPAPDSDLPPLPTLPPPAPTGPATVPPFTVAQPSPVSAAPAAPVWPTAAPTDNSHAEQPTSAWHDLFTYRVFADAYFSANYRFPKPQVGTNGPGRAFDTANGFSVAWAGLDLLHAADPVGGAVSLRFGPAAKRYNSNCVARDPAAQCDSAFGLQFVKQAYVAWKPGGAELPLTLELGKFDSIYGAEVADSQVNINYTRGVLYSLAEPWFHTGLRVAYAFSENFSATALVVNGANKTIDNNTGKSYGVQLAARAFGEQAHREMLGVKLGYMLGGERDDMTQVRCATDQIFDPARGGCASSPGTPATTYPVDQADANTAGLTHFANLAVTADPSDALHLVLDGDFGVEQRRQRDGSDQFDKQLFWGVMLGGRYAFVDTFAAALRAEYFADPDGNRAALGDLELVSGTLTLDLQPTPNLVIRLDNRVDAASQEIFAEGIRDASDLLVTSTLGVVVTTR